MKINDFDLKKWKELEDINTDSLWIINKRDSSGVHSPSYHGNFVPQIPNQMFRRYTKKGDLILDPFLGSGTSLIESQRLGRNGIGIELKEDVALSTKSLLELENKKDVITDVFVGDSAVIDIEKILQKYNKKNFQFIIYHPPYWDIIKFSDSEKDPSNAKSLEDFLEMMSSILDNTLKHLEKGRYCSVVIGDKYTDGKLIPLGFHVMNLFMQKGLELKSIIVKNIDETKGKRNQVSLWRYRSLAGGFYLFKHEYIFLFRKAK